MKTDDDYDLVPAMNFKIPFLREILLMQLTNQLDLNRFLIQGPALYFDLSNTPSEKRGNANLYVIQTTEPDVVAKYFDDLPGYTAVDDTDAYRTYIEDDGEWAVSIINASTLQARMRKSLTKVDYMVTTHDCILAWEEKGVTPGMYVLKPKTFPDVVTFNGTPLEFTNFVFFYLKSYARAGLALDQKLLKELYNRHCAQLYMMTAQNDYEAFRNWCDALKTDPITLTT